MAGEGTATGAAAGTVISPGVGTAIGAGVGAAADIYAGEASAKGMAQANSENRRMAFEQMAFQHAMSATAHQREVADLKKAGLNPVLSAGGAGAPMATGSSYTSQNVSEGRAQSGREIGRIAPEMLKLRAEIAEKMAGVGKMSVEKEKLGHEVTTAREAARAAKASADMQENEREMQNLVLEQIRKHPAFYGATKAYGDAMEKVGSAVLKVGATAYGLKKLFTPGAKPDPTDAPRLPTVERNLRNLPLFSGPFYKGGD